jgi:hypothetical protein
LGGSASVRRPAPTTFLGHFFRPPFRSFSFSIDNYRRIRREHGFTMVDVHADSGKNTYYFAHKA